MAVCANDGALVPDYDDIHRQNFATLGGLIFNIDRILDGNDLRELDWDQLQRAISLIEAQLGQCKEERREADDFYRRTVSIVGIRQERSGEILPLKVKFKNILKEVPGIRHQGKSYKPTLVEKTKSLLVRLKGFLTLARKNGQITEGNQSDLRTIKKILEVMRDNLG